GATLQLGIGSIGAALPLHLAGHRHLGVHSAIVTGGLMELIDSGLADGARKEIDRGEAIGGELLGTGQLYRWADRRPGLALRSSNYVLGEETLGRFERLVSVNSAVEVDLTGQVNAETVDGVQVGAIGGQVDFVRAA